MPSSFGGGGCWWLFAVDVFEGSFFAVVHDLGWVRGCEWGRDEESIME